MACLGPADIARIAASGLTAVDGAVDHLASCESCMAAVAARVRASRADRADRGVDQLGRYQLLGERGRGAFGSVFEAYDPALERRVAIKRIAFTAGWSPDAVAELLREAKAMAQIQHPNVIPIFDAGRAEDGVFLTMPIVDGETLDVWAARARASSAGIDADRVVVLARQIAAGLAAIHAAGFVHRDIKPSNVLVGGGIAWVADLGLARRAPPVAGQQRMFEGALTASTHTESFGGTPMYMAPECLAGGPASSKSDQYALAVTLVEVIAGTRPFAAETYAELRVAVTGKPRLERVPLRWRAVLERALTPMAEDRFGSVVEFVEALAAPRGSRAGRMAVMVAGIAVVGVVSLAVMSGFGRGSGLGSGPGSGLGSGSGSGLGFGSARPELGVGTRTGSGSNSNSGPGSGSKSESGAVSKPRSRTACVDRCSADRRRAVESCSLEPDSACLGRTRSCEATCRSARCAASTPSSAEDCRAAWLECRTRAATDRDRAERARRTGWDHCSAVHTACKPPNDCGGALQRCNADVAAAFERDTSSAANGDERCRLAQQDCVASGGAVSADCERTLNTCLASCTPASECRSQPARACTSAADTALERCRTQCGAAEHGKSSDSPVPE